MKTKHEIRREIERIKTTYSEEELFSDPAFKDILKGIIFGVCSNLKRIPEMEIECSPDNDITAYTSGPYIHLNTLGPLIRELPSNWEKYVSNVGHTVHECGHILFTNFNDQNEMLKSWLFSDKFYPQKPKVKDVDYVTEELNRNIPAKLCYGFLMKSVVNTMEDAYIENRLKVVFDGVAVQGLELANSEIVRKTNLSEICDSVFAGKASPLSLLSVLLLLRYVCKVEPDKAKFNESEAKLIREIEKVLYDCDEEFELLLWEQDGKKRADAFNILYVKLFPLFPVISNNECAEQSENSLGIGSYSMPREEQNSKLGNSDDKTDITQKSIESLSEQDASLMLDESIRIDFETAKSQESKGTTNGIKQEIGSEEKDAVRRKEHLAKDKMENNPDGRELQKAIRDVVTEKVLKNAEQEHAKELQKESQEVFSKCADRASKTEFKGYSVKRTDIDEDDKDIYAGIFRDVKNTSKNISRKISNILKERETDSTESGFMMGQRFNAKDIVNRDGKYFSRSVVPDGKPKVAFAILVDESGSMYDKKIKTAKKATILIEDVLRTLEIPYIIYGHSTEKGKVLINAYCDFDTVDERDRYRLSQIHSRTSNIDGAAITFVSEKLLKRPEDIKVLIVISDGMPCAGSFYDLNNANNDTKLACEYYRKRGMMVYGAVVDEWENVSNIYGEQYSFDCREEQALEKELVKIVRRFATLKM